MPAAKYRGRHDNAPHVANWRLKCQRLGRCRRCGMLLDRDGYHCRSCLERKRRRYRALKKDRRRYLALLERKRRCYHLRKGRPATD